MGMKNKNTAVTNATSRSVLPSTTRCPVPADRFEAERDYRVARMVIHRMLDGEMISFEEARAIETNLRSIFCPITSGLY